MSDFARALPGSRSRRPWLAAGECLGLEFVEQSRPRGKYGRLSRDRRDGDPDAVHHVPS